MNYRKKTFFAFLVPLTALACTSAPKTEMPQFTPRHYFFSVPLAPEQPGNSPQMELEMSLVQMNYPPEQAAYLASM